MGTLSQAQSEAVANGLLPTTGRIDKRQRTVARYRAAAEDFIRLLGGPSRVNAFELEIIRRAASLCMLADRAEAQLLSDPDKVDAKGYIKLSKQLHLLFLSLGLKREYRHGTRLRLAEEGEAPEDWSVDVDEDYEDEDDPDEEPEVLASQSAELSSERHPDAEHLKNGEQFTENAQQPVSENIDYDNSTQPEQGQQSPAQEEIPSLAAKTQLGGPPPSSDP